MSDDLSPEEDVVRRLLAQARHDDPPPPDVVARLDAQLADLRAERTAGSTTGSAAPSATGSVTELAAARTRRRRVPALLAAAAALVVGGVAVSTVLDQTDSGSDSVASDAGAGAERETADSLTDADAPTPSPQARTDAGAEAEDSEAPSTAVTVPDLTSDDTLRDDVRRLALPAADGREGLFDAVPGWPECATTPWGDGSVVWVLLDERPAALVVDESGRASRAELWVCGDSAPVRTFRFAAR